MINPLFVGYYTTGTSYEKEALTLRESLDGLGLEHLIVPIANRGDWQKNTQAKADVLMELLIVYPGRRLVYVDVDAIVCVKPQLLWDLDCDFAAHVFQPGSILLSGTLLLSGSEKTFELVREWRRLNALYPEFLPDGRAAWDQRTLQLAMANVPGLRFENLPPDYCWIPLHSQRSYPELRPAIVHTHGSLRHGEETKRVR